MIENIKGVYYLSKAYEKRHGEIWYKNANKSCSTIAKKTDINIAFVVGVLSALSPNNKWERNVIDAENMCIAYKSNIPLDEVKVCTYNANKQKAIKILELIDKDKIFVDIDDIREILNGNKVKAFFDCIYLYEHKEKT